MQPSTTTLTYVASIVLRAIQTGSGYGFQIMATAQLPSGTVYPALRRLEESGLIRSRWEGATIARAEQRPARKYYEVTRTGVAALENAAGRYRFPEWEPAPAQKGASQ